MADRKLFYALWPSERQRETMRDIINPALSVVEGTAIDRRNWHITLVFIGDFAEQNIPELQASAAEIEPFDFRLRFDRISFWQRPKIATINPRNVPVSAVDCGALNDARYHQSRIERRRGHRNRPQKLAHNTRIHRRFCRTKHPRAPGLRGGDRTF